MTRTSGPVPIGHDDQAATAPLFYGETAPAAKKASTTTK